MGAFSSFHSFGCHHPAMTSNCTVQAVQAFLEGAREAKVCELQGCVLAPVLHL